MIFQTFPKILVAKTPITRPHPVPDRSGFTGTYNQQTVKSATKWIKETSQDKLLEELSALQ